MEIAEKTATEVEPNKGVERVMSRRMRLACSIAGVDSDILRNCPRDDWQATSRTALAMTGSFAFTAAGIGTAAQVAFGGTEHALATAIPTAALGASLIILIDHAIVQSHWYQSGIRHALRLGYENKRATPGRLSRFLAGAARLTLSGALAFTIAGFMDVVIYQRDIARWIDDTRGTSNREVFARATTRIESLIDAAAGEIARLDVAIRIATGRLSEISMQEGGAHARDRDHRLELVRQLEVERQKVLAEARQQRDLAINEEKGVRAPGTSGLPGKFRRYEAAMLLATQAEERARSIEADIARLRRDAVPVSPIVAQEQQKLSVELQDYNRQHAIALQSLNQRKLRRDPDIRAAAEADPAFVKPRDGLVARLEAIEALKQSPPVWWLMAGVKALVILLEMAGVITKMILVSPSLYAVRHAVRREADIAEAVQEAAIRMDRTADEAEERKARTEERRCAREHDRSRRKLSSFARAAYGEALHSNDPRPPSRGPRRHG